MTGLFIAFLILLGLFTPGLAIGITISIIFFKWISKHNPELRKRVDAFFK